MHICSSFFLKKKKKEKRGEHLFSIGHFFQKCYEIEQEIGSYKQNISYNPPDREDEMKSFNS